MKRSKAMALSARLLIACGFALQTFSALAKPINIIYGTGQGSIIGQRDNHWNVVASYPAFVPPASQSYPYAAYIYTVVPQNWNGTGGFGQNQVGYTNADGTFYWIGPQAAADSALPFPDQYGYIIAQEFNVSAAGVYDFAFPANGDNLFTFFINGSISNADPMKPTIVGGTQIGAQSGDFQNIKILTGSAYLNAGVNTAYAVIDERGFYTGLLVGQSTFNPVPEPSALSLLALGLAGMRLAKRKQ